MSDAVNVLLVEDDLVEQRALQRAFRARRLPHQLRIAEDGRDALDILRGAGGQQPLCRPYLILLDLDLPGMDGFEFLRRLRADPEHRDAIVFVCTTSREEQDRARAYAHHVAGYLVKSDAGEGLSGVAELVERYSRLVQFPP